MVATAYRKPSLQCRNGGFRFCGQRLVILCVSNSVAAVPELTQDQQEVLHRDDSIEVNVGHADGGASKIAEHDQDVVDCYDAILIEVLGASRIANAIAVVVGNAIAPADAQRIGGEQTGPVVFCGVEFKIASQWIGASRQSRRAILGYGERVPIIP